MCERPPEKTPHQESNDRSGNEDDNGTNDINPVLTEPFCDLGHIRPLNFGAHGARHSARSALPVFARLLGVGGWPAYRAIRGANLPLSLRAGGRGARSSVHGTNWPTRQPLHRSGRAYQRTSSVSTPNKAPSSPTSFTKPEPEFGIKLPFADVRYSVAIGGKADLSRSTRNRRKADIAAAASRSRKLVKDEIDAAILPSSAMMTSVPSSRAMLTR